MYHGSCLLFCLAFALTRDFRATLFCSVTIGSHLLMNASRSASVSKHFGGVGSVIGLGNAGGFSASSPPDCPPSSGVGVGVGASVFLVPPPSLPDSLLSSQHSPTTFLSR